MNLNLKRNLIGQLENIYQISIKQNQKTKVEDFVKNYFNIILNNLLKEANSYNELEELKKERFIITYTSFIVRDVEKYDLISGFNSEWISEKTKITEKMLNGLILLNIIDNRNLGVDFLTHLCKEFDKNEAVINLNELEKRVNNFTKKIEINKEKILKSELYEKQITYWMDFLFEEDEGIFFTKFNLEKCYPNHIEYLIDVKYSNYMSDIEYYIYISKEEFSVKFGSYEKWKKEENEKFKKEILENLKNILKGEIK